MSWSASLLRQVRCAQMSCSDTYLDAQSAVGNIGEEMKPCLWAESGRFSWEAIASHHLAVHPAGSRPRGMAWRPRIWSYDADRLLAVPVLGAGAADA